MVEPRNWIEKSGYTQKRKFVLVLVNITRPTTNFFYSWFLSLNKNILLDPLTGKGKGLTKESLKLIN